MAGFDFQVARAVRAGTARDLLKDLHLYFPAHTATVCVGASQSLQRGRYAYSASPKPALGCGVVLKLTLRRTFAIV